MGAAELPRIDFTGVDASAPGTGRWDAVRAQVTDALATLGCFDAHYPSLAPARRAARMAELEGVVRRMVMEGLGVSQAQREPMMWHLFRMSEYGALTGDEKQRAVRYGSHQDTNWLSVVCQHEVDGLEMRARDGRWVLVQPSPESLVVMAGNALRAWSNDRVHAPFHRISVGGDATRYSAMLFSVPAEPTIRAADELVDEAGGHPRRFGDYDYDEFVRFCVSEEGGRHEDKLKAYCGVY